MERPSVADLEQRELREAAQKTAEEQAVELFAALHDSEGSLSGEFQEL